MAAKPAIGTSDISFEVNENQREVRGVDARDPVRAHLKLFLGPPKPEALAFADGLEAPAGRV